MPFVPLIILPFALTSCTCIPIPPANFEIIAHSFTVSKIFSIESPFTDNRKHELNCGLGVPALNKVGVACVKNFLDIKSYV